MQESTSGIHVIELSDEDVYDLEDKSASRTGKTEKSLPYLDDITEVKFTKGITKKQFRILL